MEHYALSRNVEKNGDSKCSKWHNSTSTFWILLYIKLKMYFIVLNMFAKFPKNH